MKLVTIRYQITDSSRQNDWIVNPINLNNLNLIVGKNAVGKSRLIELIINFSKMILNSDNLFEGKFEFTFETIEKKTISYEVSVVSISGKRIIENEELKANGVILFKRNNNIIEKSPSIVENKELKTSSDKLILSELLKNNLGLKDLNINLFSSWAKDIFVFRFGHFHSYENQIVNHMGLNSISIEQIKEMFKSFDLKYKSKLISSFNKLNYKITDIKITLDNLFIEEKNLKFPISQHEISQGMIRSLSLLILIYFLLKKKERKMLLIDDLAEGLDYERATELGKLLFNILDKTNIHMISTSNDSFIMNAIDIKYWTILKRDNSTVNNYNKNSNEKIFEKFLFTGLSNFDLFSSNFINVES